ncbi:MAG: hypothetical protein IJV33_11640 [Bacteroidaceae bacterium]|nr:hypothetical protein [Bacteroidaceae bacterium]
MRHLSLKPFAVMDGAVRQAVKAAVCLAALVCITPSVMAQDDNRTLNVNVGELEYTVKEQPTSMTKEILGAVIDAMSEQMHTEQAGYASAVRSSVIAALGDVRRFHVTDGVQVEPTEDTDFIIDGTINYISTTLNYEGVREKNHSQEFFAQIGVTLNVKDAATGTVLNSQVFEINKNSYSWYKSVDSAIRKGLELLRKHITKHYDYIYPYSAHILERGNEKSDKLKELYIDLGSAHGVQEGTHFVVYVIGTIGGKDTRTEIARLKVSKVEGDEVIRCKVVSGAKNIKTALDGQKRMLIISTD